MIDGFYTIDFHVHLQDNCTQERLCPDDKKSLFFKHAAPLLEKIANYSEPIHEEIVKYMALNHKDPISRFVYSKAGQLGLMEALRLFKVHDVNRLISKMNALKIDHAVLHSLEPLTSTAELLEITELYKDKISVFASVEKDNADPLSYLSQFLANDRVRGIKIHPQVGGYACGELYDKVKEIAAFADKHHKPMMFHTGHIPSDDLSDIHGCSEVEAIEPLISEFSNVSFILAHIGWESWRQVLKVALKYPNVYVETSWQPSNIIRRACDALGADRVLFGSDFPLLSPDIALRQVINALTSKELAYVLSANSRKLLNLNPVKV